MCAQAHKFSMLSLSSLFLISTVIGYFGVSDADVVLRQAELLPPPPPANTYQRQGRARTSNEHQRHPQRHYYSYNLDQQPHAEGDLTWTESHGSIPERPKVNETLWTHVVEAALTHPLEWKQLRQALDAVERDLEGRKMSLEPGERQDFANASKQSSSTGGGGSNGLHKSFEFTYHRVLTPTTTHVRGELGVRKRMSAITAVSATQIQPRPKLSHEKQKTPPALMNFPDWKIFQAEIAQQPQPALTHLKSEILTSSINKSRHDHAPHHQLVGQSPSPLVNWRGWSRSLERRAKKTFKLKTSPSQEAHDHDHHHPARLSSTGPEEDEDSPVHNGPHHKRHDRVRDRSPESDQGEE